MLNVVMLSVIMVSVAAPARASMLEWEDFWTYYIKAEGDTTSWYLYTMLTRVASKWRHDIYPHDTPQNGTQ